LRSTSRWLNQANALRSQLQAELHLPVQSVQIIASKNLKKNSSAVSASASAQPTVTLQPLVSRVEPDVLRKIAELSHAELNTSIASVSGLLSPADVLIQLNDNL
jgi:hypothetical protein